MPSFPVVFIDAKDAWEAKQKLLRIDSRYGAITQEGFVEFTQDIEIEMEELSLAIEIVDDDNQDDKAPHKENLSPYNKIHILISLAPEKFPEIIDALEKIKNTAGIEYEQSAN
jgi:hypothetical protein